MSRSGTSTRISDRPRLLVKSGETASIDVGNEIPVVTRKSDSDQQVEGTTNILQEISYRKTGVQLEIKPLVQANGLVDLAMYAGGIGGLVVFEYLVVDGDMDADGVSIRANAIVGTIVDATDGTTVAVLTHDAVPDDPLRKVDGTAPEPGVTVWPRTRTVPEGGTASYQVALDSQPRGPVTVSVTPAADSDPDLGATPARLTFTTSNWSTGQTVTVSAADDQDGTVGTATFRHTATSTDPEYSGIEIADVTAAENDDEYAHFIPFFPSASTAVQGFARIINRSDEAGEVYIFGIDDDGERHGPARLALSRETLHDNSIGVVDTGLPRTQDVLSEARVSRFDETGNPLGDDDTPGETHGLWVAGLAAGYGNGPTRRGVNPHSALVFVDVERARTSFLGGLGCKIGVLNCTFVTNVVQGIKTAINQGAQVVNVSWGDGSECSDRQSSRLSSRRSFRLDKVGAMHYAREKDALVVWSSGDSCENRPIPAVSSERPCSIRRRRLSHLRGRGEPGVPGVEGAGNSRRADRDAMVENGMASTGTDGAGVHRGG